MRKLSGMVECKFEIGQYGFDLLLPFCLTGYFSSPITTVSDRVTEQVHDIGSMHSLGFALEGGQGVEGICNHHDSVILNTFITPKRSSYPSYPVPIFSSHQPLTTTNSCSIVIGKKRVGKIPFWFE